MACEWGDQTVASITENVFVVSHIRELLPYHLGPDQTLLKSTGFLFQGASTTQQVEQKEHYTHDEGYVNKSGGNVKCEKSK